MEMRNVLFVRPQERSNSVCEAMLNAGWQVHFASTVEEAVTLIKVHDFAVGVVTLDEPESPQLAQVLTSHPDLEWIALIDRSCLAHGSLRELILECFFDYHTLPCDGTRLAITLGHAYGMARLRNKGGRLAAEEDGEPTMIGKSSAIRQLSRAVRKVARVDAPVLITGESGTGKELAALAIHQRSIRAKGPMVAVDCASLPPTLIQSELFGYEKGAFTGAQQPHKGHIEAATGGTLFLDEIGDLPRDLQVNLLRFLQEKTINRLGSARKIPVDARVIAATHVNLEKAVREGRFREDLYYRLNVLHFSVPALRERDGDIELLADFYFRKLSSEAKFSAKGYSLAALQAMRNHAWPGNVRELINRIRQALVMCENGLIRPDDLGLGAVGIAHKRVPLDDARAAAEKSAIEACLSSARHNVSQAARELGVSRVTLYRLMEKYAIGGLNLNQPRVEALKESIVR